MNVLLSREMTNVIPPYTGVTAGKFQQWCDDGLVVPAGGGGTQGRPRTFTVIQTVGIVVAAKLRCGNTGVTRKGIQNVCAAFGAVTEEWLKDQFARGRTHLITVYMGKPILREPAEYELVDVKKTYESVLAYVQHRRSNDE